MNEKNFRETLAECMNNPKFKKEWDASEPKYQLICSLIKARAEKKLTQQQLAKLTGITQSDISKIENGTANPSMNKLLKLAYALNVKLQFV
ncbi:helix-turn-helix domain-containing protein [Succinatimonas hippei]|mgnify:CR=1 FL=1|jgi:DNA-binding XRE family transcriptional regulator|uniref:helix-turn-helix domain-containing protein n=1 Tax=Succinatimonas hippei TaxID=626938 RepID=UPI0023F73104|nr:helix-turn-helix transcriptional regulator [Succinatimonas hippei]